VTYRAIRPSPNTRGFRVRGWKPARSAAGQLGRLPESTPVLAVWRTQDL
jgi:hypothetical protein